MTGEHMQELLPDEDMQRSFNMGFEKLKEEFGFILTYEQEDARILSASHSYVNPLVTQDVSRFIGFDVPYDPESQEFDSGDEPFPYSDGEIFDSDESTNLKNDVDSSDEENVLLFDGAESGSLTSLNTNKVCNHRSIVVNNDCEVEEVDDLATLELRKAALASITSKLESVSSSSCGGVASDTVGANNNSEEEANSSSYQQAAASMLRIREPLGQYKLLFDLILSSSNASTEMHWNDAVHNLQLIDKKIAEVEVERSHRFRPISATNPLNCDHDVDALTFSDCHLEKSMDQWIIIDETESTDASSTIEECRDSTSLTVADKIDVTDATREDAINGECLLTSEEMEDTDVLRKQLLMSIAKKRLPAPRSAAKVYAENLSLPVIQSSLSLSEENGAVSKSVDIAPTISKDAQLKNGLIFLSSRKSEAGASRRFVIQVDSESSEDEAVQTCPSSCSVQVSSFIQHIRRQTDQASLKPVISTNNTLKPGVGVGVETTSHSSRLSFSTSELAFLRRKLSQEQFTLIRDEAALQLQQRSLTRLNFIREQRLHKQNKLLRAFRSNQLALEQINKRVDGLKTALAVQEKRVEQRRLGHARNKSLMLRLQRLRSAQSLLAAPAAPSKNIAAAHATPSIQNGRQVQQRSISRKRVRSRTDSWRLQQHHLTDSKPISFDPFVPICPYFLHGKCKESGCEFQHPTADVGFHSLSATPKIQNNTITASSPVAVATALELPEYSTINEHDLSLKLGLLVRTWCQACRCFISVATQHLRSSKRCTACMASAGQSESAWLAVLHHVLCRAEALRHAAADSSAAQAELLCGAEIADRALQLLPESVPLIQHSLIFRRMSRCQDVPLTLLKALLMRTKRICILWQCAQLVSSAVWPQLVRFALTLPEIQFEQEEDRLTLILAALSMEEDMCGPAAALQMLRDLLNNSSFSKWPLVEHLLVEQRAVLWLCVVHLTVYEQLPVINSKYKLDLSQMEPLGYLACADPKEPLRDILCSARSDCFTSLQNVEQLKTTVNRYCSALQLLTCILWDAGLAEPTLWTNLPHKWSTTLTRWAAAHASHLDLHSQNVVLRWYYAEQAALHADWQLTVDTLNALVRDVMGIDSEMVENVSTMELLACLFSVDDNGLDKNKRNWITRARLNHSTLSQSMLCAVPLLFQRALFELKGAPSSTDFSISLDVLRSRAVATGDECVIFLAAALRWWCSPLIENSSLAYEDFARSAWRASTLSGRAADIVTIISATRGELLSGASVRQDLAEDVLKRIPHGNAASLICSLTLIDWLAKQDGPSNALHLCQHCLMSPMATTSPSSSIVWKKTVHLATAAGWSCSRRLDLLARATSLVPLCFSLWLIYKSTALEAGRPKLVQYVNERMNALNLHVEGKQVIPL